MRKGCPGSSGRLIPSQADGKSPVSGEPGLSAVGRLISGLLEDSNQQSVPGRPGANTV